MSSDEGVPIERIEDTISIGAGHDEVFTHLTTVEGLPSPTPSRATGAADAHWSW